MQLIMIPMNVWECPAFQRHIVGNNSSTSYNEVFSAPMVDTTEAVNDDDEDNVPRVEELPDEVDVVKDTKEGTGLRQRKEKSSGSSHDID